MPQYDQPPQDRRPAGRSPISFRAAFLAVLALAILALAGCAGAPTTPDYADQVVVRKSERKLQLLSDGKVFREYRISLGDAPVGHKIQEGDERTPEGDYYLDWRNPNSSFYKSIHVSYPNQRDRAFAKMVGVNPGGMIMVHGQPNHATKAAMAHYATRDWTDGCIAVQNHEMDEIWRMIRRDRATPIRILR